jgi:hypothetical protein
MSLARLQAAMIRWLDQRARKLAARLEAPANAGAAEAVADESMPNAGLQQAADECAAGGGHERAIAHYRLLLPPIKPAYVSYAQMRYSIPSFLTR